MPVINLKWGCACTGCGSWSPAGSEMMWPARLCRNCNNQEAQETREAFRKLGIQLLDVPADIHVPATDPKAFLLRKVPQVRSVSRFANMGVVHAMDALERKANQLDRNVLKAKLIDKFCPPTPRALKEEDRAFGL